MINLSDFSNNSFDREKKKLINRIEKSIKDSRSGSMKKDNFYRLETEENDIAYISMFKSNTKKGQKIPVKGDTAYDTGKSYVSARLKEYYKDALENKHVFAYSIGHLANDLIFTLWSTYSTWYMN